MRHIVPFVAFVAGCSKLLGINDVTVRDGGNEVSSCDADCMPRCGDGVVNTPLEECDDGDTNNSGNGCSSDCKFNNICGNGLVESIVEQCDDGDTIDSGNGCGSDCRFNSVCGNGHIEAIREVCDDGNLTCGACSPDCRIVTSAKATGQIVPPAAADLKITDTFTVNDGFVSRTFGFTNDTSSTDPRKIIFDPNDPTDDAVQIAGKMANAISSTGLIIDAVAPGNTVMLTHRQPTSKGNQPIINSVQTPVFHVSGMSGGQGGDCLAGAACTKSIDCVSQICNNGHCQ